ncbi:MAG: WG repeat-containing protein, partial [Leptospiraceae bacterium]|nr:WG repeat-containing protein [Leptospiraceae bacterium]
MLKFLIFLFIFFLQIHCVTSKEVIGDIKSFEKDWVPYRKKNKWGFAGPTGKIYLKAEYQFVRPFSNGIAPVLLKDKGWALINPEGDILTPDYYDSIEPFEKGYSIFKIKEKNEFGIFNKNGEIITRKNYSRIEKSSNHRFLVTIDGYYGMFGFINKKGKEVIPLNYDYARSFTEKRAVFGKAIGMNKKTGKKILKFGYLTRKGKEIIPPIYNVAHSFSNGLAAVVKGSKLGFIDKKGNMVIPFIYDMVDYGVGFHEKNASIVRKDREIFLIDRKGNTLVDPGKYDSIEPFHDGRARVGKGNFRKKTIRFGYIDPTGKEIIPCKYSYAEDFSEGYASVAMEKNKFGYIDKEGNKITDFKYFYLDKFKNGFGIAKKIMSPLEELKDKKKVFEIKETFIDK